MREGVAFFGAVAASVTHELNNVLSTIDQAGGLLGDMVARAASGAAIDPHRVETVRERIDRQVKRGVEIVQRFNRFAHSMDDPGGAFEASAVLSNLLGLTGRFADLKRVRLERGEWTDVEGAGDAFAMQQIVFAGLKQALAESSDGERIEVGLRRDGDDGVVSIAATARSTPIEVRFPATALRG